MNRRFVVAMPLTRYRVRYRGQKSSALVLVLGCLVFLCVLVVAFFASVSVERQSAQFYANSSSVKLLSDSAVDIVMGQIKDATKGTDVSGNTLAWASQPGMIRNYNTLGAAAAYYKLYSWGNMVGAGAFSASGSELPPSTWASSPALYTDLNDPVSGVFPIVDPSATNSVIGFSVDSTTSYASTRDAAPMPVQWLYVLKDGALAPATGSAGNTATVVAATKANPIVGRIAFWTDDDTSKININTAAGDAWTNSPGAQPTNGAGFWDTPRMNGTFESNFLASAQPVKGEFQRYPGHPATTFLSAVFPSMTTNALLALVPRVNGGGSNGGSIPVTASTAIAQKTDRLYASVDEMMFSTNLTPSTNRIVNTLGLTTFSNKQVHSASFFLTAHSRAPEVNLYNEPRIVIWPVNSVDSPNYRTAYDSLLAYCGTIYNTNSSGTPATNAYYFQRLDSTNAINDLPSVATVTGVGRNRGLLNYLQNLTSLPVPAFSTSSSDTFLTKYPKNTTGTPPNTFSSERDQILTEIFDYVRSVNTQDVSSWPTMKNPFTANVAPGVNSDTAQPAGAAQVIPIYDSLTQTRGFGRFPTVTEAGLLIFGIGKTTSGAGSVTNYPPYSTTNTISNATPATGVPPFTYVISGNTNIATWVPASQNWSQLSSLGLGGSATNAAPGYTRVQAALVSNLFDPSMGFASPEYLFWIEYNGLSSFTWKDGTGTTYPMFSRDSTTNIVNKSYSVYGGYLGMKATVGGAGDTEKHNNVDAYKLGGTALHGFAGYPDYGIPLDMPSTGSPLTFNGGTLVIRIRAATLPPSGVPGNIGSVGPMVQYMTIYFPPFTSPVPGLAPYVADPAFGPASAANADYRDIAQRFSASGAYTKAAWITDQDVYRAVVLDAGVADARMVAGMTNVPSSYFIPGPNYTRPPVSIGGHGLVDYMFHGDPMPYLGTYFGNLVPGVNYTANTYLTNQARYPSILSGPLSGCQSNGLAYTGNIYGQPYALNSLGMRSAVIQPIVFNTDPLSSAKGANGVFAGGGTSSIAPPGDWDTGTATQPDGAYINKADAGNTATDSASAPYYRYPNYNSYLVSPSFFAPNRQIASPVMFGSLPTGIISQKPWQTLLFRPDPGGTPQHKGAQSPQDHLLLDLFNMPVVEPYPISEPFSTAGKVNMNYQIVPFTYITRSTAIQAVLRSEQMLAIPTSDGLTYKTSNSTPKRRYYIDLQATLTGFTNRFLSGEIFKSATEICNIWLVPAATATAQTYTSMKTFWTTSGANGGALTGDNIRERPYSNIYPRLTTKSNTFTVHYRVETLKKIPSTDVDKWIEGTDIVTGSLRGSTTLERYLDTSDKRIPDYASLPQPLTAGQAIDNFYKFRVLETKQFTP